MKTPAFGAYARQPSRSSTLRSSSTAVSPSADGDRGVHLVVRPDVERQAMVGRPSFALPSASNEMPGTSPAAP